MEFGRRGGRSGFGENNTEYSPKSSDRVYWVHQPCWSAEKCLLCQEWNSSLCTRVTLCYLFDYASFYFNLPPTFLSYQKSRRSQALLCHLKSFWDTWAKWVWWTEGRVWILDHLHTTVNNTSYLKSSYTSRYVCETSKFPNFKDEVYEELSILPSSHPQRLFQMQANAAPKQASHWLVFTCKCGSCVWKLVCSSLLGALKTMTSSSFRRMNEALWKETELLVQNFIFTPEGRSAMILITLKRGRAENQPDGELLQCRGIMLM